MTDSDGIWRFLSQHSGLSPENIRKCKIITEISRTDTTKRKNVLIEAFASVSRKIPASFLIVSIDDKQAELARDLKDLIRAQKVEARTAVVGSIWEILPTLYAVTDIYCTPSVMEGFGMSAQEAAATGVPVVSSNLVPFVREYLLGSDVRELWYDNNSLHPVRQGNGAMVIQADDVSGFAYALECLLTDDTLRKGMGERAYHATIPYFTWDNMIRAFLDAIGVKI